MQPYLKDSPSRAFDGLNPRQSSNAIAEEFHIRSKPDCSHLITSITGKLAFSLRLRRISGSFLLMLLLFKIVTLRAFINSWVMWSLGHLFLKDHSKTNSRTSANCEKQLKCSLNELNILIYKSSFGRMCVHIIDNLQELLQ
jgi:hypothetical protein